MRPRSYFPKAAQDELLTGIDRLMQRCYLAGLRAAKDAAGSVNPMDVDPPKDEQGVILREYWTGRHQAAEAIKTLIAQEEAERSDGR